MILNKEDLLIYTLAEKNDRYATSNVHITEKFTEVTNGHYAIRVFVSPKDDTKDLPVTKEHRPYKRKRFDAIIPREAIEKVFRSIPGNGTSPPILRNTWIGSKTDDERVEFLTTDLEVFNSISAKKSETRYPNLDKVIASSKLRRKAKTELGFNPQYMKVLCDFAIKLGLDQIKLSVYSEDKPMKLEGEKYGRKVLIILMPSRLKEGLNVLKKEKKEKPEPEEKTSEESTQRA
jgi:hypothetical protein